MKILFIYFYHQIHCEKGKCESCIRTMISNCVNSTCCGFYFHHFTEKTCFKTVLYYIARSEAVGTDRDHYNFMTSALNLFMMYLCFSIVRICYNNIKSKLYHYYIVYLYGFTELFKMNKQCNKNLRITIFKYHSVDVIQNEEQN